MLSSGVEVTFDEETFAQLIFAFLTLSIFLFEQMYVSLFSYY